MEPLTDAALEAMDPNRGQQNRNGTDELIVCSSLAKAFGTRTVLRDINLAVHHREKFAILGPSGSGKSTLLRIIAGLETVNGGEVTLKGKPVAEIPASKRGVGMVFQRSSVYPHMTVEENLQFPLRCRRVPLTQISSRIAELAELLGITRLLKQSAASLSGGESQRVAIGKALAAPPSVLLLDEPFSSLDADLRWRLLDQIDQIHRELRLTTILVTHNIGEATYLADRIGVLADGALLQVASPAQLYDRPQTLQVARMLYSPSTNFINGTLVSAHPSGTRFEAEGPLPELRFLPEGQTANKSIVITWRPHDTIIARDPSDSRTVARGYWVLTARLARIAPWEGRQLATLALGDTLIRVPTSDSTAFSFGQSAFLLIPKASILAFDAADGRVLPINAAVWP